ncbi:MAG: DNA repair protein RadC [Simkaniaceae bacterium]
MAYCKIRDLPLEDRPRERLLKNGSAVLSLSELLAILIGNGTKGKSALNLAGELLGRFQGIEGLLEASLEELISVKGIGMAKAIQLKAAFALALRCKQDAFFSKPSIREPLDAYHLLKDLFYQKKKEILAVLLRDVRKKAIHLEIIAMGSLTEVVSHPREVFHSAVRKNAHSLIIAHNHPSGDPSPSKQDLELTRRLVISGSVLGIPLDDHIIFGSGNFVSLWQKGMIPRKIY